MTTEAKARVALPSRRAGPVTVLSQYPLSTAYRSAVAGELGLEPELSHWLRDFRR